MVLSRKLGGTDVEVTDVTLGTWGLAGAYGPVDPSVFESVVRRAWERGVRSFDVSSAWGDGAAEKRLALALGSDIGDAVIIGRFGHDRVDGRIMAQFDPSALVKGVEATLARIGRQHLDVMLLHHPPAKVLASDFHAKATSYLEYNGVVRTWGVACTSLDDARLAIEHGARVVCLTHNLLMPEDVRGLRALLAEREVGLLTRSPLLYGLLAGEWDETKTFPEEDHRARRFTPEHLQRRLAALETYRFLISERTPDLATAAFRFVLSEPTVSSVLIGPRSEAQLAHALDAVAERPLFGPEDEAILRSL